MLSPQQLELSITLPITRPLVPLEALLVLLDRNEDQVIELVECGALPWVWNIARAVADRRELRAWRECLVDYLRDPIGTWRTGKYASLSDVEVLPQLFPHSRPEIRGTELQRMFSCGHSHIINLIEDRLLKSNTAVRTGPNGSPRITRLSVINFLRARRIL